MNAVLTFMFGIVALIIPISGEASEDVNLFTTKRIVGGEVVHRGEFSDVVSIFDFRYCPKDLQFPTCHICGGALIFDDVVVTAGHCVRHQEWKDYQVRIGGSNLLKPKEFEIFGVKTAMVHPGFYADENFDYHYDIAILFLSGSSSLPPVEMNGDVRIERPGRSFTVLGWGGRGEQRNPSKRLRRALVSGVNLRRCKEAYDHLDLSNEICASSPGMDSCCGDSGGPLITKSKGRELLVGLVSYGKGCARPDFPGVYASIASFRCWIIKSSGRLCHNYPHAYLENSDN